MLKRSLHVLLTVGMVLGSCWAGTSAALFRRASVDPLWSETSQSAGKTFLTGYLLVATPLLRDPNFTRTVVFILEHEKNGAMGLVVNRSLGTTLFSELLSQMGEASEKSSGTVALYYGGPVEPERGFVLHTSDYEGQGTVSLNKSLSLTTRPEILRDMAAGRGPSQSMVIFGYAGWGPGQLEAEIAEGAWFSIPLDITLLFDPDLRGKWEEALDRRGTPL